ncbi:hypothetical protein U1Q18_040483, partial [Sarracenia purpurea var. burkii]
MLCSRSMETWFSMLYCFDDLLARYLDEEKEDLEPDSSKEKVIKGALGEVKVSSETKSKVEELSFEAKPETKGAKDFARKTEETLGQILYSGEDDDKGKSKGTAVSHDSEKDGASSNGSEAEYDEEAASVVGTDDPPEAKGDLLAGIDTKVKASLAIDPDINQFPIVSCEMNDELKKCDLEVDEAVPGLFAALESVLACLLAALVLFEVANPKAILLCSVQMSLGEVPCPSPFRLGEVASSVVEERVPDSKLNANSDDKAGNLNGSYQSADGVQAVEIVNARDCARKVFDFMSQSGGENRPCLGHEVKGSDKLHKEDQEDFEGEESVEVNDQKRCGGNSLLSDSTCRVLDDKPQSNAVATLKRTWANVVATKAIQLLLQEGTVVKSIAKYENEDHVSVSGKAEEAMSNVPPEANNVKRSLEVDTSNVLVKDSEASILEVVNSGVNEAGDVTPSISENVKATSSEAETEMEGEESDAMPNVDHGKSRLDSGLGELDCVCVIDSNGGDDMDPLRLKGQASKLQATLLAHNVFEEMSQPYLEAMTGRGEADSKDSEILDTNHIGGVNLHEGLDKERPSHTQSHAWSEGLFRDPVASQSLGKPSWADIAGNRDKFNNPNQPRSKGDRAGSFGLIVKTWMSTGIQELRYDFALVLIFKSGDIREISGSTRLLLLNTFFGERFYNAGVGCGDVNFGEDDDGIFTRHL